MKAKFLPSKVLMKFQIKKVNILVPPGSWCSDDAKVFCHGGSQCYDNVCVCPYGNVISGLNCVPAPRGVFMLTILTHIFIYLPV